MSMLRRNITLHPIFTTIMFSNPAVWVQSLLHFVNFAFTLCKRDLEQSTLSPATSLYSSPGRQLKTSALISVHMLLVGNKQTVSSGNFRSSFTTSTGKNAYQYVYTRAMMCTVRARIGKRDRTKMAPLMLRPD